jgi:NTE family protein
VHMVSDDKIMLDLSMVTKMFPNAYLLNALKAAGRASAETFLAEHRDDLNKVSTVNLREMFN